MRCIVQNWHYLAAELGFIFMLLCIVGDAVCHQKGPLYVKLYKACEFRDTFTKS